MKDRKIAVGLFGFGKTGRLAASEILHDHDCDLKWVVRRSAEDAGDFASQHLGVKGESGRIVPMAQMQKKGFLEKNPVDVIIDFSDASALKSYIGEAAKLKIKVVSAISQYGKRDLNTLKRNSEKTAILHSPNITLGINVLLVASQVLKKIMPHADIEIVEEHFRGKREKSGTALKIAEHLGLDPKEHVNSIRVGGIIGRHEVIFGMKAQTVRLVHESISRAAFARGALFATKWIVHKRKGLFSMEQLIRTKFMENLTESA
ncbi:MAG: hypothetical protein LBV12_05240 [Puniceicoccales bacterium]|jgi:4-hydroxy-tetrahydrodipicolinate reductase|nr:hypothetical protein [Puniceicoccales bacterium]